MTREQLEILHATGAGTTVGARSLDDTELFLDAILGYGQRGVPHGGAADLITATAGSRVLALDVPSGLPLEDGTVAEPAIRTEATMTLALPKAALRGPSARPRVGDLYLADIGIPPAVYERVAIRYRSPFSGGPIVRLVANRERLVAPA